MVGKRFTSSSPPPGPEMRGALYAVIVDLNRTLGRERRVAMELIRCESHARSDGTSMATKD